MSEDVNSQDVLSNLLPGERAKVTAIELPGSQKGRLMEMGLTIGVAVEFVRVAPLGDPIEIKVRGSHLSLRKVDANEIKIIRL